MSQFPSQTPAGPAKAVFDLPTAQRIVAATRKVEQQGINMAGAATPQFTVGQNFWAMITTATDLDAQFFSWIKCQPSAQMATSQSIATMPPSNMWVFSNPAVTGWGNARERNGNPNVPGGTVVLMTFMGYAVPDNPEANPTQGTTTDPNQTTPPTGTDGSIPIYSFQYDVPAPQSLPVTPHDHRDNLNGGFAFACLHPGTALPSQPWSI